MNSRIFLYMCTTFNMLALLIFSLIALWQYHSEHETIIGGILSMIGGALGALGAYYAAKKQIDSQMESLEKDKNEKARPYIIFKVIMANFNLKELKSHSKVRILHTDYYDKSKYSNNDFSNRKINFSVIKILGLVDYVFDCKVKLILDKEHCCNQQEYSLYLDYLEKEVEIFIPLPFSLQGEALDLSLVKLEFCYETSACEKIKYVYDYIGKIEESYLIEKDKEVSLWKREFEPMCFPERLKRTNDNSFGNK